MKSTKLNSQLQEQVENLNLEVSTEDSAPLNATQFLNPIFSLIRLASKHSGVFKPIKCFHSVYRKAQSSLDSQDHE